MRIDTTITLIAQTVALNEYNTPTTINNEREVFASVDSIAQSEFFKAGQIGLHPDFKLTMQAVDYENEKLLKFDGVYYSIYRVYRASIDLIELYAQERINAQIEQKAGE